MPPICPSTVRRSACLQQLSQISAGLNMSQLQPPPPQPLQPSCGRGRARARARARARGITIVTCGRGGGGGGGGTDHPDPPQYQHAADLNDGDATPTPGDDTNFAPSKIRWETVNHDHTTPLVSWLAVHSPDCHILFSDNKKQCDMTISTDCPSGRSKAEIHLVIAKHIFTNDPVYGPQYAVEENRPKFGQAVANCLAYLRGKYKAAIAWFGMTGAGVNPLNPQAKDNPAFSLKTFSSVPGKDRAGGLHMFTQPKTKPIASSSVVCLQPKGKERALDFDPDDLLDDDAPRTTTSNIPNPPADSAPPATFTEAYDPAHDNYDPMYNNYNPVPEELDYTMGGGNWDGGAEDLEMEEDNYGDQSDTWQRLSSKHPYQMSPSPHPTFKPLNHASEYDRCEVAFTGKSHGAIERDEAASVHVWSQEAKALELHLLKAQAKVQSEKAAALHLEIELINLKEVSSSKGGSSST
ncbi:uncharacterized protein BJ212DRAFT_1484904 [Suillus subaureus]|uniref:Uncharacterized protein n=1 Tax=Suillus subaureus TaxID=48587 RepID=A0A9P7J8U4_9AGAM|nr:uncharacterized protein BJ212DRAFT_1484904 [Suillus subaureus]KAG1808651.1 hypothetical protein BJ212DRAFT_1484904 [Suillus subaureus]